MDIYKKLLSDTNRIKRFTTSLTRHADDTALQDGDARSRPHGIKKKKEKEDKERRARKKRSQEGFSVARDRI